MDFLEVCEPRGVLPIGFYCAGCIMLEVGVTASYLFVYGYNTELHNAEYTCDMRKIRGTAQYLYK